MLGRVFLDLGVRGGGRGSKRSLNPFIVNFLRQSAHPIFRHFHYWKPYGSSQESRCNYLFFPVDEDLSGVDNFFLDSSVVCVM